MLNALQARTVAGLPIPKAYAWSPDAATNPVGAEYIIMEKAKGSLLSSKWPSMSKKEKIGLMQNVVFLEKSLTSHPFQHIGSVYYESDMRQHLQFDNSVTFSPTTYKGFVVGPTTSRKFLHDERRDVRTDRGPCQDTVS
jgi:hypothetical protein